MLTQHIHARHTFHCYISWYVYIAPLLFPTSFHTTFLCLFVPVPDLLQAKKDLQNAIH
ncbi:hypothetical protein KVT40_000214 [Elsinoe batatas]|uniref:Uncharacterized protein n=1 Tax=Elsinoe batatas TaxID=2601811 RepID=A0A8K0L9P0_9PEZI|nr:hypothetical protein KVT40_000214 [Elsinoe batatas]